MSEVTLNFDASGIVGILALGQTTALLLFLAKLCRQDSRFIWFTFLFLTIIIALGHDVILQTRLALYFPQILGLGSFATYLVGPLVLLLTLKLIKPQKSLSFYHLLHFIPFVWQQASHIPRYLRTTEIKREFLTNYYQSLVTPISVGNTSGESVYTLSNFIGFIVFYGHRFAYLSIVVYLLNKCKVSLEHQSKARTEFIQMQYYCVISYCVFWISMYVLTSFPEFIWLKNSKTMINSIGLSTLVFVLSYWFYSYSTLDVFSLKSTKKYQKASLGSSLNKQIYESALDVMKQPSFYLKSEVKLADLSTLSGFSTHQLSQAINAQEGLSFNQILNECRVEEVKQIIKDDSEKLMALIDIAYQSGFNSKATFNRVFKQIVGMTPKQYRDSCF